MFDRNLSFRLAFLIGLVAVGLAALPVVAQDSDQPADDEMIQQAMERSFEGEVTVTGSLIPRKDLESMSPVAVLDPEEIAYSGVTRLEDIVAQMPQVFQAQNSTVSNGASGTATIDLRYLGTVRTLVLINGKRMPAGDAFAQAPDINFIPSFLVKRVDILTGGASSVYGADAVAGVVNFVIDTDFEGVKAGISYGSYWHDNNNATAQAMNAARGFDYPSGSAYDGQQFEANFAVGGKFADGKGHGSMYIDYRKIDPLTKAQRDYTACSPAQGANGPTCGGSGTIPQGRFLVFDEDFNFIGDYVGDWDPYDPSGNANTFRPRAGEVFNYGPLNYMQRPDEKWSAGGFANYEFNEHFDAYGSVMFMDDFSEAQIAYSGNFGNTGQVNCDNPMLSPQQFDLMCTQAGFGPTDISNTQILRRSFESSPRTSIQRHTSWRIIGGLRGDINDVWSYDVYGLYAEVLTPQEYIGDLSATRMQDALIVDGDPDDPSTWVCRSGNAGCAPWNLFQQNGVTQAALDYIALNQVLVGGTKTLMANGTFNADLEGYGLMIPSANEGIQIAVGAEYREESLYVHPDENFELGLGAGSGGPTTRVNGKYDVTDLFIEALIPVIQDVPMARDLSFELGYRYSDYSTSGGQNTWKVAGSWAPTHSFKFRAGYNQAIRSPNVRELYRPQGLGLNGSNDICSGPNPSYTLEQCMRTGVTAAQYGNVLPNPAQQYNSLDGGNPDLMPETANTLTVGVVITPQSVAGLSFTFDYYDIQIEDTVGSLQPDDIVQTCATTGDPLLCSLIHRDVAGTLWLTPNAYTVSTNQNLGSLYAEGIDFSYGWLIGLGNAGYLNTSLLGSYMLTNRYADPLIDYDCVGYYGDQCGIPNPKWRHRARISWETTFDMVFSLGWRYNGSVKVDDASPNPAIGDPGAIEDHQTNGTYENSAFNYFDLALTWRATKELNVILGLNNVLDEEPPLGAGFNRNDYGPGWYGFYDPYGRTVHASLQFTF